MPIRALAQLAGLAAALSASAQPCGNPWTIHQGPGPSAREASAIAYDSARGKVVLFGGRFGSSIIFSDTWEWTSAGPSGGGSWSLIAAPGPPTTANAAMAYDSVRQRVVMFGGYNVFNSSGVTNATWEWNGASWTLMQPAQSPPPMSPIMAFDPVRGRTVLVSTIYSGPESQTTWEYDGLTWTRSTESTPIAQWFYDSMAFDAARSIMVLFHNGLWERTPSGWQYVPESITGSSQSHRIIFDPGLNRIAFLNDDLYATQSSMWSWNAPAGHWAVTNTSNIIPTTRHNIAYDQAGQQILAHGGGPISGWLTAETRLARSTVTSGPVVIQTVSGLFLNFQGPSDTLTTRAFGNGPLTYQWRRNGVNLTDGGPYSGTQTSELTITPLTIAINGWFDAIVTDACGSTTRPRSSVHVICYPDCDGVGGLTNSDFMCFLNQFVNGSNYANCDGSTVEPVLTANDFICFLQRYLEGCG